MLAPALGCILSSSRISVAGTNFGVVGTQQLPWAVPHQVSLRPGIKSGDSLVLCCGASFAASSAQVWKWARMGRDKDQAYVVTNSVSPFEKLLYL